MFDLVHLAMRRAVAEFGGKDGDKVFNAAGFSVAFAALARITNGIDGCVVEAMLCGRGDVEQLSGGAHYRLIESRVGGAIGGIEAGFAPHQLRVVREKFELDEKIEKLASFCKTQLFQSLHPDERQRLYQQLEAMEEYSRILGERIVFLSVN